MIGKAKVLNLSIGGDKDLAEIDILRDVIASGVVVIAAMGNEYQEGNPTEDPAAMAEVCAVGAIDERDKRAGFSNTGRHIDLMAPGVDILSTTPTFAYDDGEREYHAWTARRWPRRTWPAWPRWCWPSGQGCRRRRSSRS